MPWEITRLGLSFFYYTHCVEWKDELISISAMTIYEVNLSIQNDIAEKFNTWLLIHVDEMLRFEGFLSAKVLRNEDFESEAVEVTVIYTLSDRASLQTYFDKHSEKMRDEGIKHFPNQFEATRRIFKVLAEK